VRPDESIADLPRRLDLLPAAEREFLAVARRLAGERAIELYCVGGGVRDLLLDRPAPDLDLLVSRDLAGFAGALADHLGGRVRAHPEFLTATLELPDGTVHDLAAARRERYPSPGALPVVEPASGLAEDLARRDFSVNALALELPATGGPARLHDPWGGLPDLGARRLRVLHAGSFLDDPTRIVRGLLFEARLGLRFDDPTRRLAVAALEAGALATLSSPRLRQQLDRAFEEAGTVPVDLVRRGAGIGLWRAAFGLPAPASAAFAATLGRLLDGREEWRAAGIAVLPSRRLLAWLALFQQLPEAGGGPLAERHGFPADERAVLAGSSGRLREARRRLAGASSPHVAHAALAALAPAELLLLAVDGDSAVGAAARREAGEWRELRLSVRGSDLIAAGVPPGPRLGEALRRTLAARLDGEIGREGELAFALAAGRPATGAGA
jgi:tRNA nucleotidyltransferase (CCA-adding enzyme)